MGQVQPKTETKCRGCPRIYDNAAKDLCQVPTCGYCRICHHTVYGQPQPHAFNQAELIPELK